ncbi:hypothetical protein EON64_13025 [archaeon]|nr:MAG: hypothetical protein EON64_13025 [archaeon]
MVGTAATQTNMHIRLAAIKALNNSLDFTSKNFEIAPERDAIMRAVCECTQAADQKIREVAFECCATVADLYYDKLAPYAEILFNLSTQAIKADAQEVGMQAIEFWNTVCDQEIGIMEDMEEGVTDIVFLRLIAQAAAGLVPLVLECMTKQEEDADEDTWNISMAAATLLESLALTLLDQIVDLVLPFITQNINNVNWRLKESALMAFGMILDGPSAEKLSPLVIQAMPILINCLKDPKVLVRDTSAWVIGKICELHQSCISGEMLPAMVSGLSSALDDKEGKVVSQACYAVHNLAAACADESEANSNVLSHFMPVMLQKLMGITSKSDWETENVRSAAYEAMNMMVENSALDMKHIVSQLLLEALNRLEFTFNPQFNLPDKMNVQSALCSLVGQIVRKLEYTDIAPLTDRILQMLLEVFKTKGAMAHEDALLAMGFLAEKMKENFVRYLQVVQAPLLHGLSNIEEHTVCTAAVGVLGDICRSVGKAVAPYCDEIMKALLVLLQSNTLNRAVKPHVISVFADIAMAIEGDFARYVSVVMAVLKSAGEVTMTTDDEDLVEYINLLRNSILEAYSGIIQGLKEANQQDLMMPSLMGVAEFIQRAGCDSNRSDEVLKSCVGLIGDMGQSYGAKIQSFLQQEFVSKLINDALLGQCNAEEVANWAKSVSFVLCCRVVNKDMQFLCMSILWVSLFSFPGQ